jgi:uncharacterized DUF497 family protein
MYQYVYCKRMRFEWDEGSKAREMQSNIRSHSNGLNKYSITGAQFPSKASGHSTDDKIRSGWHSSTSLVCFIYKSRRGLRLIPARPRGKWMTTGYKTKFRQIRMQYSTQEIQGVSSPDLFWVGPRDRTSKQKGANLN